jgi:hypothetical protein
MITIMQGSSRNLSVTLKDINNDPIDPAGYENIILELYHEAGQKILARYSTKQTTGYDLATAQGNVITFFVRSGSSLLFPPGKILGKFTLVIDGQSSTTDQVSMGRGGIFNVVI